MMIKKCQKATMGNIISYVQFVIIIDHSSNHVLDLFLLITIRYVISLDLSVLGLPLMTTEKKECYP